VSGPLAEHWGIPVTEVPADDRWPLSDYPAHGPDRDDPFLYVYQPLLDSALTRASEEGCTVVLSGDRGDLVLGEPIYDYPELFWSGRWGTLLSELQVQQRRQDRPLRGIFRQYLWRPARAGLWPPHRARRLRSKLQGVYRRWRPEVPSLPPWLGPRLVHLDYVQIGNLSQPDPPFTRRALRRRYRAIHEPTILQGMTQSNRMQAPFGIGFTDAWSDRRLVTFALAVPQRILNTTGHEKRLVKAAIRQLVPEETHAAMGKTDPSPFFEKALRDRSAATISSLVAGTRSGARGWIDEEMLRRHYESVRGGEPEHDTFWWALCVEMWLRAHFAE
jgi:asparagine synthase (glutamine-hydrolysing)